MSNGIIAQKLADTVIHRSIENASRYLSQSTFNSQFNSLILKHLEAKYKYQCPLNVDSILQQKASYVDEEKSMIFFRRMVSACENVPLAYIDSLQGLEKLMAWAIHSDQKKIDSSFVALLWEYSAQNQPIRNVAHAALVLTWLRENEQLSAFPHADSLLKQQIVILSKAIIPYPHRVSDSEMEAAIGLLYLTQKPLIADKWFHYLVDSQEKDGGWEMNEASHWKDSQGHPTTLAIWLLHLYLHDTENWTMLEKRF